MTITELLWLFFAGVLGVAAAAAIPVAAALVERLLQAPVRRSAQETLTHCADRDTR
jgi:hypothetical protein